MSMGWTATPGGFPAQIPILDLQLFEITFNGSQITRILSQTTSRNLKGATLRHGVGASTMIVLQSVIRRLRMSITKIILGRELPYKACTWHGVGRIGDTVSSDFLFRCTFALTRAAAAPVVYTSYDYSAPLRETRQIQDKLYQTKLIGLFTRVSTDLLKTYMVGNGTGYAVSIAWRKSATATKVFRPRRPESGPGRFGTPTQILDSILYNKPQQALVLQ